MSTDLDAVIKNVAKENGVGLYKDDPVMVLVTIINQLADDQRAGVVGALEKYREVHEDIALRWRTDAGKVAGKILNAALDAGRAEMAKAMSAGAAQVVRIVNEATEAALVKQRVEVGRMIRDLKVSVYLTAVGTFALAVGAVLMAYMATR
jgi:hypothetical protein